LIQYLSLGVMNYMHSSLKSVEISCPPSEVARPLAFRVWPGLKLHLSTVTRIRERHGLVAEAQRDGWLPN
jgi:hypothetical protein